MNKTKYIRTESEEQQMLFRYCSVEAWRYPQLETLMHVPNESRRSVAYGAKLKREGMRKGYPDITLFAGSRMKDGSCYHALMINEIVRAYIERSLKEAE